MGEGEEVQLTIVQRCRYSRHAETVAAANN